ncbi:DNA-directed RNA polymerase subunit alpha [Faecalibacter macacae]|uniref:DNA-directed RNA polymerase subunit alpha n=1 Tax=Faecalibacter macacae TaxID=1859289 RepID=A0A3L9MJ33_9FLAO|nr:DNA-directed RNA polymerase subunit alpha [Faecalibacter macacae]RLZ12782.1 DNA-directed RNA polymerase subunit alpha [Faecalibacter macacae]
MTILNFIKPDKVILVESDSNFGQFEFRPLEPGYGITVGNALRRVLLSSLEGFAITSIKIEGVEHEFSTIPGVVEDVTEIILNLKKVRFKKQIDESDAETVTATISGQDQLTAGDLGKFISGFQVLNPELVIANLDSKVNLTITFTIEKGRGYVPAEENKKASAPIGTVAIDSIYTPIKNVKYSIENYRVEQKTDYEKLVLEITTDGSITPQDALTETAKILIHHFMLFSDERITLEAEEVASGETYDEEALHMRQLLKTKLVDMDLSVRALNCLKAAEVETLGELVSFAKSDLMKFRNFGKKSLTELEELVDSKGLNFGMDIAKYKLDVE